LTPNALAHHCILGKNT